MNGLLFLNGDAPSRKVLEKLDFLDSFVVCADGAYDYLAEYCVPDILIGDFDSIKKQYKKETVYIDESKSAEYKAGENDDFVNEYVDEIRDVTKEYNPDYGVLSAPKAKKTIKLKEEKDYTDGHQAMLEIIKSGAEKILIYGALGGQPDHQLSNYSLLYLAAKNGKTATIVTEKFEIFYVDNEFSHNIKKGKRVSLVPFTDEAHILKTKGLKYPIYNEIFNKLHIKGISNISVDEKIGLKLKNGAVLVFVEI